MAGSARRALFLFLHLDSRTPELYSPCNRGQTLQYVIQTFKNLYVAQPLLQLSNYIQTVVQVMPYVYVFPTQA